MELNDFNEFIISFLFLLPANESVVDLALDLTPDLEQRLNVVLSLLFCLFKELLRWFGSRIAQIVSVVVESFADSLKENGD